MTQDVLGRAPGVMEAWVSEDELVLLAPGSEDYVGLNAVAADIWERLAEPAGFAALVAALARDYDAAPEVIEADVSPVIETLLDGGLLVRGDGA